MKLNFKKCGWTHENLMENHFVCTLNRKWVDIHFVQPKNMYINQLMPLIGEFNHYKCLVQCLTQCANRPETIDNTIIIHFRSFIWLNKLNRLVSMEWYHVDRAAIATVIGNNHSKSLLINGVADWIYCGWMSGMFEWVPPIYWSPVIEFGM